MNDGRILAHNPTRPMAEAHPFRATHLVHKGVVDASGLLFGSRLVENQSDGLRGRVLSVWTQGSILNRLGSAWLLRFPSSRRIVCRSAPGLVLVETSGSLFGFPMDVKNRKALGIPQGALVWLEGGRVSVESLASLAREDPSTWLDLDEFDMPQVRPLGMPPDRPRVSESEPQAPFDLRERLAGVPAAATARDDFLRSLDTASTRPWSEGVAPGLRGAIRISMGWLRSLAGAATGSAPSDRALSAAPRGRESWFGRLISALGNTIQRLVAQTPVGRFIAGRQAAYLQRLMQMFDRGDVDDALKHAIPLGGPVAEKLNAFLRSPRMRQTLVVRPGMIPAASTIHLEGDWLEHLRRLYRTTFQRLEAQGRIDEAAFVLAELLFANEEAVAFLERHGRLKLAAEMAEARGLPPGLVVRQWFVAGERGRAVEMARRSGAFSDAVQRLERSQCVEEAAALRLLWAHTLASAGSFVSAVDVVWPLAEARHIAKAWIDRGIAIGGPAGAAMLVRKLTLDPESFDEVREKAVAVLSDETTDGARTRIALAEALARTESSPGPRTLMRPAARAVLRDAALYGSRMKPAEFQKLITFAEDAALRADMPALSVAKGEPLASWRQPLQINVEAGDAGTVQTFDAAFLPNGQTLVALGEAGVALHSRAGKRLTVFDVPAHRIVLSDGGDRAIAVARRGEVSRLSRLDLVRRTADNWCDARVDAFAPTFDGLLWFVATEDLYAIDTTGARFDAYWRVPDLVEVGGRSMTIARSNARCVVLVNGREMELWSYELPSLTLRARRSVDSPLGGPTEEKTIVREFAMAIAASGLIAEQSLRADIENLGDIDRPFSMRWSVGEGTWRDLPIGTPGERPGPMAVSDGFIASAVIESDAVRVVLVDVAQGRIRAQLRLEAAREVCLRLDAETLTMGDDRGRLLVLDLDHGWLLRDVRI